jgi:L-threonylcarbamoyladenylate synthase
VAFPTETVYGLGADATNEKAVSRIYSVKGRPTGHPLIVHISSVEQLKNWAKNIPDYANKLAREFWPGPMTLILERSPLAKDFITGGQDNVGLRVPANPIALALLNEFEKIGGVGIAAPSANRFGAVSPTTSEAVNEEIGKFLDQEDSILNGGPCRVGIESTIIDCTEDSPKILRPGATTEVMIEKVIAVNEIYKLSKNIVKASGLLESHYSPRANVVLNSPTEPGDGFIAMMQIPTPDQVVRLGSPATIEDFARDLYELLRLGDKKALKKIVVITPKGMGISLAIRDRLLKASRG